MKKYIIIAIVVVCLAVSAVATFKIVNNNKPDTQTKEVPTVNDGMLDDEGDEYQYYDNDEFGTYSEEADEDEETERESVDYNEITFPFVLTTKAAETEPATEPKTEPKTEKQTTTKKTVEKETEVVTVTEGEKEPATKNPIGVAMTDDFKAVVNADSTATTLSILKKMDTPYSAGYPSKITVRKGKCTIEACSVELSGVQEGYYMKSTGSEPFYAYCFKLDGTVPSNEFQKNLYNNAVPRPASAKAAAKNRAIAGTGGYVFFAIYP